MARISMKSMRWPVLCGLLLCLTLSFAQAAENVKSEPAPRTAEATEKDAAEALPIVMDCKLIGHDVYPGDPLTLEVTFRSDKPFAADLLGDLRLDGFEYRDRTTWRGEEDGKQVVRHRIEMARFETGPAELPRLTFVLKQGGRQEERQNDAMRVTIKSLLEEEAQKVAMQQMQNRKPKSPQKDTSGAKPQVIDPSGKQPIGPTFNLPPGSAPQTPSMAPPPPGAPRSGNAAAHEPEQVQLQPRDIKDPVPLIRKDYLSLYLLIGFAVALLIGLGLWFWLRRRKPAEDGPTPAIVDMRPAHVIAMERLADLEAQQLVAKRQLKEYHLLLSEILREYFERRYGLKDALSLTSEEVGRRIGKLYLRDLDGQMVYELFHAGDLVKFAKDEPTDGVCLERLEQARMIVRRTREETVGIR